jgi:DNA-binding CsgD family transcriptional regulator
VFDDFVHDLTSCKTLEEVSEAFRKAVSAHGYTASAARAFVPTESGREPRVLFRNWSSEWAALSDQKGFTARSFVVAEARKRMTPFTWHEIMTARPLSRAEKEVWDNARAFGWSNGFVLPVHGPGGYFAILSMASPERDLDLHPARLAYLQMIALLAHERSCALSKITSFSTEQLTARELECIRWVVAGKTDSEIGNILSVSEATIKFHINGARRKLGARNRAQAAARLVLCGLY